MSLGTSLCTFLPTGLFRIGSMQPALFFCSALYPGHARKNRSIKCCRAVFSTPQAFLSILRISLHENQNNFCDFIISPHEKCKNLRGGAGKDWRLHWADTASTCLAQSTSGARGSPAAFRLLLREPLRFLKFPFRAQIIKSQKLSAAEVYFLFRDVYAWNLQKCRIIQLHIAAVVKRCLHI